MGTIIKVIILGALLLLIAYVGLVIYSCATDQGDTSQPEMPKSDEAAYSVYIENTGNLILTDDYEVHGSEVGSRVFILHGFWELTGQDFKYKEGGIILQEAVFGEITVRRR